MKKEHIDTNSFAHTSRNCKCHIVFAPNNGCRRGYFRTFRIAFFSVLSSIGLDT